MKSQKKFRELSARELRAVNGAVDGAVKIPTHFYGTDIVVAPVAPGVQDDGSKDALP